jgi:hypothetical protein
MTLKSNAIANDYHLPLPLRRGSQSLPPGPGLDVPLPVQSKTRRIRPVPGCLVLFPSYFWHGAIPFGGPGSLCRL